MHLGLRTHRERPHTLRSTLTSGLRRGYITTLVLLTGLIVSGPRVAHASDPVAGGRYKSLTTDARETLKVKLNLANDGLSFAAPSFVEVKRRDGDGDLACVAGVGLAGFYRGQTVAHHHGRFVKASFNGTIRGRFIQGGRAVVGRVTYRGDMECGGRVRFRAPLTDTPNATRPGRPSNCDQVTIRWDDRAGGPDIYRVIEQGMGCTAARRLARQWDASAQCAALPAAGPPCTLDGGAACETIAFGTWRKLAGVRCSLPSAPGSAAELVHEEPCRAPDYGNEDGNFGLWAVKMDCRTARAFRPRNVSCPDADDFETVTCAPVDGYTCTFEPWVEGVYTGYDLRCFEDPERTRAILIEFNFL
jgi:hypothetical protein